MAATQKSMLRPLHRLRRSPSPASQGRISSFAVGTPWILPCEAGEGNHAKHGGGGGDS